MKQTVKYISTVVFVITLTGIVQGCRTPKEPVKEEVVDHGSEPTTLKLFTGTVRVTDDCGAYLDVIQGDVAHSYYPVNLDVRYQIDGMRLKFSYEISATKPPEKCPNFEPIRVSDVTPIR